MDPFYQLLTSLCIHRLRNLAQRDLYIAIQSKVTYKKGEILSCFLCEKVKIMFSLTYEKKSTQQSNDNQLN